MSTYLQLCQDFVREVGINGGSGPATVVDQTGELGNVVRWIRDADNYINTLWRDWKYLWVEYSATLDADSQDLPAPNPAARFFKIHEFYGAYGTDDVFPLEYMDWSDFRQSFAGAPISNPPNVITISPAGALKVDALADVEYTITGEYYRRPVVMAANTDTPMMPEEFHRLIIARCMIYYGNREDAPELVSGGESEYIDLLEKLEGDQLDGRRFDRRSEADIRVETE